MTEPLTEGARTAADDIYLVALNPDNGAEESHTNWISELSNLTRAGGGSDRGATEQQVAMLMAPGAGPIELTDKDFDKIGPKAAQVLKDAGVKKLTITSNPDGTTHIAAELAKGLDIA